MGLFGKRSSGINYVNGKPVQASASQLATEIARIIPEVAYDKLTSDQRRDVADYLRQNGQGDVNPAEVWNETISRRR